MGIKDKIKKITGRSNERFTCNQDPQTKKIVCKSFREFEDGTREDLARIDFEFDAQCHGVATHMEEFEEGALERLEKKSVPRLKEKCEKINVPEDY